MTAEEAIAAIKTYYSELRAAFPSFSDDDIQQLLPAYVALRLSTP